MDAALDIATTPAPTIWSPDLRRRLAKLVARFGDANDNEALASARAIAAAVDVHALAEFVLEAEPPEPRGGPTAILIRRLLSECRQAAWSFSSRNVVRFNDLAARFEADGRLSAADIAIMGALHREARRRA
jgi:hypothetical protein